MNAKRRVALYLRVSSDEQREKQTIQNQRDSLQHRMDHEPDTELVATFADDGISGTVPLAERPGGAKLVAAVERAALDEIWVTRADRLGRDALDLFHVWDHFQAHDVRLVGVEESLEDEFQFDLLAVFSKHERKRILDRMAKGMARIVREGKYPGGIVPYGYHVLDSKLAVDPTVVWGEWTAVDVILHIFMWAAEGRSSRWIAEELNRLGVPTSYNRAGPGSRRARTAARWWPGRIQQILKNTTYVGQYVYGKRGKPGRELIEVSVPRLVSDAVWEQAHVRMGTRSRAAKTWPYLLRSRLLCHRCGLNFTGSRSHGTIWYRCNGQLAGRGETRGRCSAKAINGTVLEAIVWDDIERFLREPGTLLDELAADVAHYENQDAAAAQADRLTLEAAFADVATQRDRILDLYQDGRVDRDALDVRLDDLRHREVHLHDRLAESAPAEPLQPDPEALYAELRRRLDAGLSSDERQEIAQLLVKRIVVDTTDTTPRQKQATLTVEYLFVAPTTNGRGSSPRPS
jgi:site-specific DNA recombinase